MKPAGEAGKSTTARLEEPILDVEGISTGYPGLQVLWDVSFTIRRGEAVALIGSNGAGKTTLLRCLAGQLKPWQGAIRFEGRDLSRVAPHDRVKSGMVMVPEGRQLFSGLTALENLLMGAYTRGDAAGIREDLDRVWTLFPQLKERGKQLAGHMSGGEQQMCAIGRALMSRPTLLMIDELSLGLAPILVERLVEAIDEIHRGGVTLLVVEQDVGNALTMAGRGYVLETGKIQLGGTSESLLKDPRLRESFIGI